MQQGSLLQIDINWDKGMDNLSRLYFSMECNYSSRPYNKQYLAKMPFMLGTGEWPYTNL